MQTTAARLRLSVYVGNKGMGSGFLRVMRIIFGGPKSPLLKQVLAPLSLLLEELLVRDHLHR